MDGCKGYSTEELVGSICYSLDVDREGGVVDDLGKFLVGSVLRGGFGSRLLIFSGKFSRVERFFYR